jgi:carboxymethylenebutenolidase
MDKRQAMRASDTLLSEHPILAEERGRDFDSYLSRPEHGVGPGLIILTEMWGTTALNRDMADSYARRGWCALVPSMFWRSEQSGALSAEGPERDAAWERLREYDFDRGAQDVRIAADWLRRSPFCSGKLAVIGYCMGGRTAFLACARSGVDAGIALYALGIRHHLDEVGRIECPVQLHYGLADIHIPRSEIDEVMDAAKARRTIETYLYPGVGHGFFNPLRPAYDAAAVALARARIDGLLETLK